jgi:long-chain fatty acid transport protein
MKRITILAISVLFSTVLMAGGIVTNTNQSAYFTRLQARDATLGIDAVYFNPAGLTLLPNKGLYLSLNNQTLGQTRTITSGFPLLNESEYIGDVSAPIFPGIYVAYKLDKLVFSVGFNPIGGGGGGVYENGVPSFEKDISLIPGLVSSLGVPTTAYSADIYLEGTSVYFGYQGNISYAITEMISVALGGRYVMAKNTNQGHVYDIMINPQHPLINPTGGMMSASEFFTAAGQPTFAAQTADRDVDIEETASGFTPVISVNIKPSDKLNFALKYEHNTKLEFETKVIDDKNGGIYTDGAKFQYDIPSQLVVGATFKPMEKLLLSTGFHYYLDQQADWEGRQDSLEGNSMEIAIGAEYALSEKLLVSAGYLFTSSGAGEAYQEDLSYSLPSSSIGGGFSYQISPAFEVTLAGSYTMYQEGEKNFAAAPTVGLPAYVETYDKDVWIVAVGLNINLGAGK